MKTGSHNCHEWPHSHWPEQRDLLNLAGYSPASSALGTTESGRLLRTGPSQKTHSTWSHTVSLAGQLGVTITTWMIADSRKPDRTRTSLLISPASYENLQILWSYTESKSVLFTKKKLKNQRINKVLCPSTLQHWLNMIASALGFHRHRSQNSESESSTPRLGDFENLHWSSVSSSVKYRRIRGFVR